MTTDVRRRLERVEIPDEHEARVRSWELVRRGFDAREPVPRRRRHFVPALAAAAVVVAVAAVLTPPGRAVLEEVREVIGVERAQPALFSLPANGRVLAVSSSGAWIAHADGSTRRLGAYREASWSPFGRFVVVARGSELAAVTPDGAVRWKLARPNVRAPRWGGSRTDTRIAYLSRDDLRAVGGDRRGDKLLVRDVDPVAPSWRPATYHFLAYARRGWVIVIDAESRRRFWSRRVGTIRELQWSPDGELLLVRGDSTLRVYGQGGTLRFDLLRPPAAPVVDAAFGPDSRSVAFVQQVRGRSAVWLIPRLQPDASAAHRVFEGAGRVRQVEWSPNGRWLLVNWHDAAQWVFVRTAAQPRIVAVSNVASQFESASLPRVEGWCCASR